MVVKNDLFDYENRYIFQDNNAFKFSVDSILLAEYARPKKSIKNILDMCAGNMAVGLILSTYTNAKMVGFEIQKNIYDLGLKSIEYNNLDENLEIINDDVKNINNYYKSDFFDEMVVNPPYFKVSKTLKPNKNDNLSIARHEIMLNLEDVFLIARKYLVNNGSLYMVHRSDRIDEIIINGSKNNVNVKEIVFVKTKVDKNPTTILVKCTKNSKFGVKIRSEICIDGKKTYKDIFEENV